MKLCAESGIIGKELAQIFRASMFHNQKTTGGGYDWG
jgi:hypothetical protein